MLHSSTSTAYSSQPAGVEARGLEKVPLFFMPMSQKEFVIFPPDKCHLFFSSFYLLPKFESGSRLEKADLYHKERAVSPWLEEKEWNLSPAPYSSKCLVLTGRSSPQL